MDQYELIRTAHRVYKKSIRQIARETGHTRRTVRKVLAGQEPKYRREKEPACPVMDPVAGIVDAWLQADRDQPVKQRHTAHRVWQRLVEEHEFTGAEPTVRRWVRERKTRLGWNQTGAVVPLDPEHAREAEVDWGTAWVRMNGQDRQVKLFCMRSRYSGKAFVRAYPWERQEMFLDGHIRGFDWYGGVFPTLVFDNLKTAVKQILRGKGRVEQTRFTAFRAHYTFEARFCNPARGQEKGGVEGLVGFARRNFLVPVPEVTDFDELNAQLLERCGADDQRRIGGRSDDRTIGKRHGAERAYLLALPGTREFIGILQLHQDWDLDRVSSAIQEALDAHCIELEAVRHILMREDTPTRSHAPLESGLMPGITDLTIARADLDQYDRLLAGGVR